MGKRRAPCANTSMRPSGTPRHRSPQPCSVRTGYWLRDRTPKDSRVMSWWDYGYQITGIGERTTLADGNTWSAFSSHLSTAGLSPCGALSVLASERENAGAEVLEG